MSWVLAAGIWLLNLHTWFRRRRARGTLSSLAGVPLRWRRHDRQRQRAFGSRWSRSARDRRRT
jgi:hypothetical protein